MLEFLKEITSFEIYILVPNIEKDLLSRLNAMPMRVFFEVTFKELYKKQKRRYSSNSDIDRLNLDYFLTNSEFKSKICSDYYLNDYDWETLKIIRINANKPAHQLRANQLDDDKLYRCFKCVYKFSSNYYEMETGKEAPPWSDSDYATLLKCCVSDEEKARIIKEQSETINSLSGEFEALQKELTKSELHSADLEKQLEEALKKPDDTEAIDRLKAELKQSEEEKAVLNKQILDLKQQLFDAFDQLARVTTRTDTVENSFKDTALKAAELYYDYLVEEDKKPNSAGKDSCIVSRIQRDTDYGQRLVYRLYLEKNPRSVDYLQIRVGSKEYSQDDIKPLRFNKISKYLLVAVSSGIADPLEKAAPGNVIVFSDIKFLIKNILRWYECNGDLIKLPVNRPSVDFSEMKDLSKKPTPDQDEAIKGVLEYPFTYVWGAPGTGKTQFVLSRAILSYIREKKKVLVTAPTNIALEQTLKGLLEVFEESDEDYNKLVIRYGTPTYEFAEKYPRICEDVGFRKSMEEIEDIIDSAREEEKYWSNILKQFPAYRQFLEVEKPLSELEKSLPWLADNIEQLSAKNLEKQELLSTLNVDQRKFRSELGELKTQLESSEKALAKITKRIESDSIFKKLGLVDTEKLVEKRIHIREEKESVEAKTTEAELNLESTEKDIQNTEFEISSNNNSIKEYRDLLSDLLNYWPEYREKIEKAEGSALVSAVSTVKVFADKTSAEMKAKSSKFEPLRGLTEEQAERNKNRFHNQITEQEERKEALLKNAQHNDPSGCLVVAATIDKVISMFSPDTTSFAHIFLDEAGYCSLIKGAVLTAFGCPVTLLGDHMQLPPVFAMDGKNLSIEDNRTLTLFKTSALYIENAFSEPMETVYRDFETYKDPLFNRMVRYQLTNSHRFGPELANVLDDIIYQAGFKGDPDVDTKIYYINAPKETDNKDRVSLNELKAIDKYLDTKRGSKETIGILTPYTKSGSQLWSLKDIAARHGISKDAAINIHKSQGKEWDIVLFSVVDTYQMWFTDSNKKETGSVQLINTAISRAKKELIIVCDYNFWIKKKDQFIGKLLEVAEEYPYVKL